MFGAFKCPPPTTKIESIIQVLVDCGKKDVSSIANSPVATANRPGLHHRLHQRHNNTNRRTVGGVTGRLNETNARCHWIPLDQLEPNRGRFLTYFDHPEFPSTIQFGCLQTFVVSMILLEAHFAQSQNVLPGQATFPQGKWGLQNCWSQDFSHPWIWGLWFWFPCFCILPWSWRLPHRLPRQPGVCPTTATVCYSAGWSMSISSIILES